MSGWGRVLPMGPRPLFHTSSPWAVMRRSGRVSCGGGGRGQRTKDRPHGPTHPIIPRDTPPPHLLGAPPLGHVLVGVEFWVIPKKKNQKKRGGGGGVWGEGQRDTPLPHPPKIILTYNRVPWVGVAGGHP